MIAYSCRVADPAGQPLIEVANFLSLDYALSVGGIGVLQLTMPTSFDDRLFRLDGRVGVWRSIHGRPPTLDGESMFLIRTWQYTRETTTMTAYHAKSLLQRRILAYYAGTTYTTKNATPAGNLIKALVRENLGVGIVGTDRLGVETQADLSAWLAIQANMGDGANVAAQDAYADLYDLIKEIGNASTQAGIYLTTDIVAPTESTLELRTYAGQRGVDHRAGSAAPIILSEDAGTLTNCQLIIDRSREATMAICAGTGGSLSRITATSMDAARMGESPFNRIEVFGDYTTISDPAALQAKADAIVRAGRPHTEFTADIVETPGATRGIHYDLGDLVTAEFRGQQYDCRLDTIGVSVGGGGAQTSKARVRYVG